MVDPNAAAAVMSNPSTVLIILLIGGLMGMLGQGARAVAGLKSMTDEANSLNADPGELFQATRLIVSLIIGLLVGLAAAVIFLSTATKPELSWSTYLGFAAAGYTGTDFLEAFLSKYLGKPVQASVPASLLKETAFVLDAAKLAATAQAFVYQVLADLRPGNPIADDTPLKALAYDDAASKDVLRWEISRRHWHGVTLPFGSLNGCSKVSDVVEVVKKAEGVVV